MINDHVKTLLEIQKPFLEDLNKKINLFEEAKRRLLIAVEAERYTRAQLYEVYTKNIIELARSYAAYIHCYQIYNKQFPYTKHLDDVVTEVKIFSHMLPGLNPINTNPYYVLSVVLGYLHDSIEDAGVTYNDIYKIFGPYLVYNPITNEVTQYDYVISEGVLALSQTKGKNRKERSGNYNDIKNFQFIDCNVVLYVKLCDRIANLRNGYADPIADSSMLEKYKKEHSEFTNFFYNPIGEFAHVWDYLEILTRYNYIV